MLAPMIPLLLAGALFAAIGAAVHIQWRKLVKVCTAQTSGTVTALHSEVRTEYDEDTKKHSETIVYYPEFTYTAKDRQYTRRSGTGSSSAKRYTVGQVVTVLYDPDKPDTYLIKGDKADGRFGLIFCAVGVAAVVFSFIAPYLQ